jgi:DNA-binding MarR family transcriptional regulator
MNLANLALEIDQCNCFTVRKAARRVSRLYEDILQPTGLRITQFLILAVLAKVPGASVNELAERLDLERTAMGKTLGPLERDGLIRIEPSPVDARSRLIRLTSKGNRAFEDAVPLWRQAQQQLAELNGTRRLRALRSSLSEIRVDRMNTRAATRQIK